jgi:hypothetical protein
MLLFHKMFEELQLKLEAMESLHAGSLGKYIARWASFCHSLRKSRQRVIFMTYEENAKEIRQAFLNMQKKMSFSLLVPWLF